MKKYIPDLMELYLEMEKANAKNEVKKNTWVRTPEERWNPFSDNPYSSTMMHALIVLINKLNNKWNPPKKRLQSLEKHS